MHADAELNESEPELIRSEIYVLCKDAFTCCKAVRDWYGTASNVEIFDKGTPIDCDTVYEAEQQKAEEELLEAMLRERESDI